MIDRLWNLIEQSKAFEFWWFFVCCSKMWHIILLLEFMYNVMLSHTSSINQNGSLNRVWNIYQVYLKAISLTMNARHPRNSQLKSHLLQKWVHLDVSQIPYLSREINIRLFKGGGITSTPTSLPHVDYCLGHLWIAFVDGENVSKGRTIIMQRKLFVGIFGRGFSIIREK